MNKLNEDKLNILRKMILDYYEKHGKSLLFHGWHHIFFVQKKSIEIAATIDADLFYVETTALVHDLNYLVEINSDPEIGKELRHELLQSSGYEIKEIDRIESIVMESHTAYRGASLSLEGQAISDADTVFKILPITPMIFSSRYIMQNQIDIKKLARKITNEQNPLLKSGIYFYTDYARERYQVWAEANIGLWNCVLECLEFDDIQEMLSIARDIGVI